MKLRNLQSRRLSRGKNLFRARGSMLFFLLGIIAVVLIGIFPNLRPAYEVAGVDGLVDTDQVSMGMAIMIVMIAIAGLIMVVFKASPEAALKGTIMRSGITAIICILGISWLGSSFFEGNRDVHRRRHLESLAGLSMDVCDRDVRAFVHAVQPGGNGCDPDAGRHGTEVAGR